MENLPTKKEYQIREKFQEFRKALKKEFPNTAVTVCVFNAPEELFLKNEYIKNSLEYSPNDVLYLHRSKSKKPVK